MYIGLFMFCLLLQLDSLGQWDIVPNNWSLPTGTQYLVIDNQQVGVSMPFASPKSGDTWRSDFQWKYRLQGEQDFQVFPGVESMCITSMGKLITVQRAGKLRIALEIGDNVEWIDTQNNICNDIHPFYDDQSRVLVFASDRAGGHGGFDLYKMIKTSMGWSSPVALSAAINSEKDEKFPMISAGDLYFSSPTEMGDWDIFQSPKKEFWQVKWQLESPINSNRDEFQWWPEGENNGWLISNRSSQSVNTSLFYASQNQDVSQKQICLEMDSTVVCTSMMQGKEVQEVGNKFCFRISASHFYTWQFSSMDGLPMVDLPITIKDGQGNVVAVLYTDEQGRIGWQYLPFAFHGIQWWNEPDQSHLLATSDPTVYVPIELVDSTEVYFETGSSEISEVGQKELLQMAFYLMLNDEREVWIRGSADATGNVLINEKLAWERAWKVQNFLLAHGVLVGQMNVEIVDPQFSSDQERERKVSLSIR